MWQAAREHELYQQIWDAVPELFDKAVQRADRDGKHWAQRLSKDEAVAKVRGILDGEVAGVYAIVLADTHLMFVSVGNVWWSDKPWLLEQWYMRIAPGRSDPLAAVDELAKDLGCSTVVFGTSLSPNDRALGRLLERSGYQLESTQYIKDYAWQP